MVRNLSNLVPKHSSGVLHVLVIIITHCFEVHKVPLFEGGGIFNVWGVIGGVGMVVNQDTATMLNRQRLIVNIQHVH